jgi:hypothetical protein
MKPPLTDESEPLGIALGDCLNGKITWFSTKDPIALWRAEVGPHTWTVHVNNFPEDHLYTLFINGNKIGDFDEWPRRWLRTEEGSSWNPAEADRVTSPQQIPNKRHEVALRGIIHVLSQDELTKPLAGSALFDIPQLPSEILTLERILIYDVSAEDVTVESKKD